MHANRLQWERRSRTVQFTIDADQPGAPTASAPVTFVQASMIPERLFGRLLAALVTLAALAGVWFGLVKPAINDAADDAVAKQLPAAISSTSVVSSASVVVPNPSDSTPASDSRRRRHPTANRGHVVQHACWRRRHHLVRRCRKQSTFPPDRTSSSPTSRCRTPTRTAGVAVLSNGTNVIYTLSLADVNTGDKRVSLVSPIEVVGGTQLVLQVSCVGAGNISGVCTTSMLVSGRMVPAPPVAPAG